MKKKEIKSITALRKAYREAQPTGVFFKNCDFKENPHHDTKILKGVYFGRYIITREVDSYHYNHNEADAPEVFYIAWEFSDDLKQVLPVGFYPGSHHKTADEARQAIYERVNNTKK